MAHREDRAAWRATANKNLQKAASQADTEKQKG